VAIKFFVGSVTAESKPLFPYVAVILEVILPDAWFVADSF
jgi:hypothetical protein